MRTPTGDVLLEIRILCGKPDKTTVFMHVQCKGEHSAHWREHTFDGPLEEVDMWDDANHPRDWPIGDPEE